MANVHTILAWIAVAGAAGVVVVAGAAALGRVSGRILVDRAILVQMASLGAAAIAGLPLPAIEPGLGDPLHLVYAALAAVVIPAARFHARGSDAVRIGRWVAGAGILALGAIARLFMTGA